METTASSVPHQDAGILRKAVRDAVISSPGSFLSTIDSVEAQPLDYWAAQIRSATWVVAERGVVHKQVVGIAASKRPDPDMDREDPVAARYIESVWVAPCLRRRRVGERLIKYLLASEYCSNQGVRQFVLWVYATNAPAMRLYEHLGFVRTPERNVGLRTEVKYRLDFDPELHTTLALVTGPGQRAGVHRAVTYRVLGQSGARTG